MPKNIVVSALLVAIVAAGWLLFAPTQVGGQARYVITQGTSMEPAFKTGDLAIVRPADRYQVGEIAAYHSTLLNTTVLHRIVGRRGGRYTLAGDHNTWRDPEHPGSRQMLGRLFLHIPRGGDALNWLHRPANAGSVAFLAVLLALAAQQPRRHRHRLARARSRPMPPLIPTNARDRILPVAVIGLLLSLVLTTIALASPTTRTVTRSLSWTEQTSYRYHATVPRSPVYPNGQITTGQTVYQRLAHQVTVTAHWALSTTAAHQIHGTIGLSAEIRSDTGWTHAMTVTEPRPITESGTNLTAHLDLASLTRLVDRVGTLTGVPVNNYTVTIAPVLDLHGTLAGQPLSSPRERPTPLTLNVTRATMAPAAENRPASTSPQSAAPQHQAVIGPLPTSHTMTEPTMTAASWPLLAWRLPVSAARIIGAAGSLLAIGILAALWLSRPDTSTAKRTKRPNRAYRHLIVPITELDETARAGAIVDVPDLAELAKIAQRYNRLILHDDAGQSATYYVEDEGTLYRQQVRRTPAPAREPRPTTNGSSSKLIEAPSTTETMDCWASMDRSGRMSFKRAGWHAGTVAVPARGGINVHPGGSISSTSVP